MVSSPPPADEKSAAKKHSSSHHTKSSKHSKMSSKRSGSGIGSAVPASHHHSHQHHEHAAHAAGVDSRHKRVWKACERCRMKKTKCDGEFPCKRCKDDGLVCTAGVRKKVEYKQLPRGYAEVLENTQFALIATVHKLYSMVRNSQPWELGEPDLNDRGLPVIHDIAHKLGCIRPNSDIDLPAHSVFPEDEAGMAELARQLEEQQPHLDGASASSGGQPQYTRASSSDLDHSDMEDYRKMAFGSSNSLTLSPGSFTTSSNNDIDYSPTVPDMDPSSLFTSSSLPNFSTGASWQPMPKAQQQQQQQDMSSMQFLQQGGDLQGVGLLNNTGLDFGIMKPDICNDVMMGMGDPMIYSGFEGEPMRL